MDGSAGRVLGSRLPLPPARRPKSPTQQRLTSHLQPPFAPHRCSQSCVHGSSDTRLHSLPTTPRRTLSVPLLIGEIFTSPS